MWIKLTSFGVEATSTITIHKYANKENIAVVQNTFILLIFFISFSGIPTTQTEMMTRRLNAAEPTIVPEKKQV